MISTGERLEGESNDFQSQISSPVIISLSKEPLTWGVEIEFVFAFHETQLDLNPVTDFRTVPAITHPTVTDKKLAYWFRRSVAEFNNIIPWHRLPHRVYNSWGLHNEGKVPKLQPYSKEVHYILERLLKEKCPSIDTRIEESKPINEKDNGMYEDNQWLIMRDYSVCGVGSKNIRAWLPRVAVIKVADWDSYGLELVSPIFSTGSNNGYNDIVQILEATKGKPSDPTGAFITNQCALHAHIGAPRDLKVLKELAILIIVYESEISKLHPHCRRPEHPNARYAVESNRLRFLHQDKEEETRYTYGDLEVSNAALARQPENFLANIRAQIDGCSTPQELALLMNWPAHGLGNELGNRARQVNFTAAARPTTAPYTVEFRQARGTLDANDVQKWVEFCTGLVKIAQFYVDNPGRFSMKTFKSFRIGEDGEPVAERFYIMDLMNDMGMSEDDKEYWRVRMAKFAARGGPLDRVDYEKEAGIGEDGEGIPGDGGDDDPGNDPGEGPSWSASPGNGSGGQNEGGNSGGNNDPMRTSSGVNNGSAWGNTPPQSPLKGGRKSPKNGQKRGLDDNNKDEDEEVTYSKKQNKTTGNGNAAESTGGAPSAGESVGGENFGANNPDGNKPPSKALGKRKAQDDANKDIVDDEEQQEHASKKQNKGGEREGGQDGNSSNENMSQIPQASVAPIATTLSNLFSYIAHFLQAPPVDSPPIIPPDIMRPVEGMIAPLGLMSPDDAMIYHEVKPFAWEVQGFHSRYWRVEHTGYIIGQRRYVCSVLALLGSMRNQYPDSPYASISAEELLALFDRVVGRRIYDNAEDNELADLIGAWTGNDFRVVIMSDAYDNRSAYRAGILEQQTQLGRNLYVHWKAIGQSGTSGGHWESMRRRPTPRPDPSDAAGPSTS